jgi:hypothetical protein
MRDIILVALAFGLLSTGANADCKADLQAVMADHLKAGPYHADITIDSGGSTLKVSSDVILPDQFHMRMPQAEAIKTSKGLWMKIGGKWQPMPASVAKAMQGPIDQGLAQGLKNVKNLNCLGAQTYENQSLAGYEFDSVGEIGGTKSTAHVVLYADPATGLPAYIVVSGEAKGKKSTTTEHITFDPGITISPPG